MLGPVLISLLVASGGAGHAQPVLTPIRSRVVPGEPVLLRLGVRNTGSVPLTVQVSNGSPVLPDPWLEWRADKGSWRKCRDGDRHFPKDQGPVRLAPGATLWSTGEFYRADNACEESLGHASVEYRVTYESGQETISSVAVRVETSRTAKPDSGTSSDWLWGYRHVDLSGPRQCSVWPRELHGAEMAPEVQRGNRERAEEFARYLTGFPAFPFRECIELGRASLLAGSAETGAARKLFSRLASSAKDSYIREQAQLALSYLEEKR